MKGDERIQTVEERADLALLHLRMADGKIMI